MDEAQRAILLVEDNPDDAFLFSVAIRSQPCISLQTVWNGRQAIEYLEGQEAFADRLRYPLPDIIVLDLRMTILDGFEFLAWRSTSRFVTVPVVILAAMDNQQQRKMALQMGAIVTYSKPVLLEGLRSIVAEICALEPYNQRAASGKGVALGKGIVQPGAASEADGLCFRMKIQKHGVFCGQFPAHAFENSGVAVN